MHGETLATLDYIVNSFIKDNFKIGNKYIAIIHPDRIGRGFKNTYICLSSKWPMIYIEKIYLEDGPEREGQYWNEIPVIKAVTERGSFEIHKPVTFIVGENGMGKSTLLEAIAVCWGFNPEGGTKNMRFSTKESHLTSRGIFALLGKTSCRARACPRRPC